MLSPGISGSYVLCLLGVYPDVLYALSHLQESRSLLILLTLIAGMILGLALASKLLRYFLSSYPRITLVALGGALVGGIPTLSYPLFSHPILIAGSCIGAYLLYILTPSALKQPA